MKVCLVSDTLPGFHRTWSGGELVCWKLGQMLRRDGHSVLFMTTKLDKEADSEETYQIPYLLGKISILVARNVPFDLISLLWAIAALRKAKPDVVHIHSKLFFFPALLGAMLLRIPVVLTVLDQFVICPWCTLRKSDGRICTDFHGPQCAECILYPERSIRIPRWLWNVFHKVIPVWPVKLFGRYRATMFDYFVRKLDAIVVLSETSKARLEEYGLPGEKIKVIYHYQFGPELHALRSHHAPSNRPTVFFVGALYEHKGLHVLVQAMSHIVKEIPQARLRVIGSGDSSWYMDRIQSIIQNLELEEHIEFLGQRANEEVLQLMSESDVVVVPEQWPNDYGPVVLVEAKVLAKPIVASRIGATPEFIEEGVTGFLVAHDQPQQFADKVVWLLQHKEAAREMGRRTEETIRFLYEDRMSQELINLYRSVIEARCR